MLSIEDLEATHRIPEKGIMSDVGFARRFSRKLCRRRDNTAREKHPLMLFIERHRER